MTDNTIKENLATSQGSPISNNDNGITNTVSNPLKQSMTSTGNDHTVDQDPPIPSRFEQAVKGGLNNRFTGYSSQDVTNTDFLYGNEDLSQGNLEFLRGERQSGGVQLLKGVGRVGTKVASEVLKLPGYVGGLVLAPFADENEGLETIVNNAWIKAIQDGESAVNDNLLSVYSTAKTEQGEGFENLWNNITSTSFWAKEGADGIGFIVSMWAPGAIVKTLGLGAKLTGAAAKSSAAIAKAMGSSATEFSMLHKMGRAGMTASKVDVLTTGLANTLIESSAEAGGAMENFSETRYAQIAKKLAAPIEQLQKQLELGTITEEQYEAEFNTLFERADKQIQEQKAQLGANIFTANLGILMGPNLLQSSLMYGAPKAALTTKAPKPWKVAAKEFGKGVISEGFFEEGLQTTVENYYTEKAEKGDLRGFFKDTSIGGVLEEYGNTLTSSEGMKSIFLGGMLGGPMNAYHGVKQAKSNYQQSAAIVSLVNGMNTSMHEGILGVYQKDKDGNIVLDKNGKPVFDSTQLLGALNAIGETALFNNYLSNLMNESTVEGEISPANEEAYKLIQEYLLTSYASAMSEIDNDGQMTKEAFDLNFGEMLEALEKSDKSDEQKAFERKVLESNKALMKGAVDTSIRNRRAFDMMSELINIEGVDTSKVNKEADKDKVKKKFIESIRSSFIDNQNKIDILGKALKNTQNKIEELKRFSAKESFTKGLEADAKFIEAKIAKLQKKNEELYTSKEEIQKNFDNEFAPSFNKLDKKMRKEAKLTEKFAEIANAETLEDLEKIKNDDADLKEEVSAKIKERREELKKEKAAQDTNDAEKNNAKNQSPAKEEVDPMRKLERERVKKLLEEEYSDELADHLIDIYNDDQSIVGTLEDFIMANEHLIDEFEANNKPKENTPPEKETPPVNTNTNENTETSEEQEVTPVPQENNETIEESTEESTEKEESTEEKSEESTEENPAPAVEENVNNVEDLHDTVHLNNLLNSVLVVDPTQFDEDARRSPRQVVAIVEILTNIHELKTTAKLVLNSDAIQALRKLEEDIFKQTGFYLSNTLGENIKDLQEDSYEILNPEVTGDNLKVIKVEKPLIKFYATKEGTYFKQKIKKNEVLNKGVEIVYQPAQVIVKDIKPGTETENDYRHDLVVHQPFQDAINITNFQKTLNEKLEAEIAEELELDEESSEKPTNETNTTALNTTEQIPTQEELGHTPVEETTEVPLEEFADTFVDNHEDEIGGDDLSVNDDVVTYQETGVFAKPDGSDFLPRIIIYNNGAMTEWAITPKNKVGTTVKVKVVDISKAYADRVGDIQLLQSYMQSGNITANQIIQLIKFLPLEIEINDNGKIITANLDNFSSMPNREEYNKVSPTQALVLRYLTVDALLSNKSMDVDITTKVAKQYQGALRIGGVDPNTGRFPSFAKLDIFRHLNQKQRRGYLRANLSYNNSLFRVDVNGRQIGPRLDASGNIYLSIPAANGDPRLIKLNQAKFTKEATRGIYEIFDLIVAFGLNPAKFTIQELIDRINEKDSAYQDAFSGIMKDIEMAKNIYGKNGNMYHLINFFVHTSDNVKTRIKFRGPGVVEFGSLFGKANKNLPGFKEVFTNMTAEGTYRITQEELDTTDDAGNYIFEQALANYLNYLNRNIKTKLLNNDAYLDYILDNGILTTNVTTEGPAFGNTSSRTNAGNTSYVEPLLENSISIGGKPVEKTGMLHSSVLKGHVPDFVIAKLEKYDVKPPTNIESSQPLPQVADPEVALTITEVVDNKAGATKKDAAIVAKVEANAATEIADMMQLDLKSKLMGLMKLYRLTGVKPDASMLAKLKDETFVNEQITKVVTENEGNKQVKDVINKMCGF